MPKARRTTKLGLQRKRKSFTKFLSVFEEETELQAFKCNKEIAKLMAEEAKEIIESQSYKWQPLSDQYLEDKIVRGYDPRIYIRTGEFLESISWGVTHGRVWTGIPARAMHTGRLARADESTRRPVPMRWLARWLEFGTTQKRKVETAKGKTVVKQIIIPPRPIWRPLLSKYIRLKSKFGTRYRKALKKAVDRRTRTGIK